MSMKFEIVMSGTLALSALGGVWKASELSSQIEDNEKDVATIEAVLYDHTDRLARIETKLDLILQEKK